MNPIILPPAMGKLNGRLGSSALVRQLVLEKENSEFKPVKLRLKIDLVSYRALAEGLGKYGKDIKYLPLEQKQYAVDYIGDYNKLFMCLLMCIFLTKYVYRCKRKSKIRMI